MITGNIINGEVSAMSSQTLQAINPASQTVLPEEFHIANEAEVDQACAAAHEAWEIYRNVSGQDKAYFIKTIADQIEALGDTLVHRVMQESGLPEGRVRGERGRTCNQLRMFAQLLEKGNWVEATINTALPERKPIPRVDLRKMLTSIGPVAVFTASNFPLAFSTAGGDTASALAAGCPVIVKGHPSHPGTHALISEAIHTAAQKCGLPGGVFSSLHGLHETGRHLVSNPMIKAVGFTGSLQGGLALQAIINLREEPIPFYGEMGSTNPIFVLPKKAIGQPREVASTIAQSVNLGAGQFCTNPGIIVVPQEGTTELIQELKSAFSLLSSNTMLNKGIWHNYEESVKRCLAKSNVNSNFNKTNFNGESWDGHPGVGFVSALDFLQDEDLSAEIFGPFTIVVLAEGKDQMVQVAKNLEGQLTASIMGFDEEINQHSKLVNSLKEKCGRLIFNGVPTGVEVCEAMHHGGPFPSTTNSIFTSVGTSAIKRFARPLCFQNAPDEVLPPELKDGNPLHIWRNVDGEMTQ